MIAALTGTGLAAAAGLNAYIPFLLVALLSRFTDVIDLPAQYAWIESNWAIAMSAVSLLSEMVLDKIAIVDHLNDLVATLIRPTVGGLIFAATTAAEQVDESIVDAGQPLGRDRDRRRRRRHRAHRQGGDPAGGQRVHARCRDPGGVRRRGRRVRSP